MLYESLTRKFGPERYAVAGSPRVIATKKKAKKTKKTKKVKKIADHSGFRTFLSLDAPNDPEAPTTVHGVQFPYQTLPKPTRTVAKTIALPDYGSVQYVNHVVGGAVPQAAVRGARSPRQRSMGLGLGALANAGPGLFAFPRGMSNALLISAKDSASGHPLAVMGPQVSYFAPQILMEEDIHGPGIDADGAAFPGVNLYVELGHGQDYAWSATSAGQNIIDTFAVPLCSPGGGTAALSSDYYLLHGQCVQMETLDRSRELDSEHRRFDAVGSGHAADPADGVRNRHRPRADPRPSGGLHESPLHIHARARLGSRVCPVQRSGPDARSQDFFNAAYKIGYTFNWFYTDNKHIAYYNSGLNPVRAAHTDALFPTWSQYSWKGFHPAALTTPSSLTEQQTSENAHPHVIDQDYLTSWNNKQAPGYGDGATGQEFSSVYRSQLLDNNISYYMRRSNHKMTLADLINAMGTAGTEDLRGVEVLPYALKVIGHPSNPALATAVNELNAWVATGPTESTVSTRVLTVTTTRALRCASWMPGGLCWSGPSSNPYSDRRF